MSTFQPPPDGFDDALRRSRTRRHRRHLLAAAAGGTTLALVTALVLTTHPGGLASLRQEQPAGPGTTHPSATSSATPTPTPAVTVGAMTPSPAATNPGLPGSSASVTAVPSAAGSASPTGRSTPTVISSGLSRRTTVYSNLTPCSDTSGRQATGWCFQPASSFTGRAGHPNTLAASLCRLPGMGDGPVDFPTSLEITFAIHTPAPADRAVWDLAAQHPGQPHPHRVTVTAGECLTWTASWFGRDNNGRVLRPGHYTLGITLNSDSVGNPNEVITENYDYTVSD